MRNRCLAIVLVSVAALAISAAPALAQGRGRGHEEDEQHQDHGHGRGRDHGRGQEHERAYFGQHDRDEIASYYRDHRSELPPGLARREELPPGLERYLRRNGQLPPGLQKRVVWFPADLDRRLGPLPYGYRRCWVGNNVLVVNPRTFSILDVSLNFSFVAR
jgi:Ni/Co efflux regulator RcnB